MSDTQRDLDEFIREVSLTRDYAIAKHEVTQEQFDLFLNDYSDFRVTYQQPLNPDSAGPALRVSWYAAAAYCNWLSRREGLPPEQWCYRPNRSGNYAAGMTFATDYLQQFPVAPNAF